MKKSSFHLNYEKHIYNLTLSIQKRTYRPEKSSVFVVSHPKLRDIIAAHIRDRIVHHFIYDYMAPVWEKKFVPQSYACRPGMGPLQRSRRFSSRYIGPLPRYKSMFYADRHKGLAIGNLTSQFYANIYLNELDQFVRHKIRSKVLFWQRYVDDVCFLSTDPQVLRAIVLGF